MTKMTVEKVLMKIACEIVFCWAFVVPGVLIMRLFFALRRFVKGKLCRLILINEYCHDCGVRQPLVWTAPNKLWNEVANQPEGGGCLCPVCFDRRATRMGKFLRWVPHVE
jgi:hypothetical protein